MKRYTVILLGFLLLLLAVAVAVYAASPRETLHRLERDWQKIPDGDTMDLVDAHLKKMEKAARELLVLEVGGRKYPCESVYFTSQPEGHVCRLIYADDTAHTTEFPLAFPVVPWEPGTIFQARAAGSEAIPLAEFILADPGEMHGASYAVRLCRPDAAGRFSPRVVRGDRPQIMFTIVKETGDLFFRKYVWVVDPATGTSHVR